MFFTFTYIQRNTLCSSSPTKKVRIRRILLHRNVLLCVEFPEHVVEILPDYFMHAISRAWTTSFARDFSAATPDSQ